MPTGSQRRQALSEARISILKLSGDDARKSCWHFHQLSQLGHEVIRCVRLTKFAMHLKCLQDIWRQKFGLRRQVLVVGEVVTDVELVEILLLEQVLLLLVSSCRLLLDWQMVLVALLLTIILLLLIIVSVAVVLFELQGLSDFAVVFLNLGEGQGLLGTGEVLVGWTGVVGFLLNLRITSFTAFKCSRGRFCLLVLQKNTKTSD